MPCRLGLRINGTTLDTTPLLRDDRLANKSYSSTTARSSAVYSPDFADSTSETQWSVPTRESGFSESEIPTIVPPSPEPPEPAEPSAYFLLNIGSTAQDHLAAEATFLSYVQTSLAIASAGVVLSQLFMAHFENNPPDMVSFLVGILGTAGVCLALWVIQYGHSRYFAVQIALSENMYPVAHAGLTAMSIALGGIVLSAFFLVVLSWPEPRQCH